MKFSIPCSELKTGLQKVISVIPTKTTLPILGHILFEARNGQLTLTTTDLEVTLKTQVQATIESEGSVTIPGRLIFDVVRELPDIPLNIVKDENNRIVLTFSKNKYSFFGEDANNYPKLPAIDVKYEITFDKKKLKRYVEKTVFATSTDELRPALMGVLFQVGENDYKAVSTDGHRLVKIIDKSFKAQSPIEDVIVPVKALNLLLKNIEGDEDIKISFAANYIVFDLESASISATLIEGKYPDYDKVIPINEHKKLIIDREKFISSLRTISVLANKITQQIKINLEPDKIIITSEDMDLGEGIEIIEAEYTGEQMEIGFNSNYLLDILTHLDSENVIFTFNTSVSATLVFPITQEENEDILMLVMPIKLKD
ncbi:hypothetical protein AMJ80_04650 [bacterium SM23_31]|nr:MAG: hypothetical protein AMJ80_04650 [bacterium SM23_31]